MHLLFSQLIFLSFYRYIFSLSPLIKNISFDPVFSLVPVFPWESCNNRNGLFSVSYIIFLFSFFFYLFFSFFLPIPLFFTARTQFFSWVIPFHFDTFFLYIFFHIFFFAFYVFFQFILFSTNRDIDWDKLGNNSWVCLYRV